MILSRLSPGTMASFVTAVACAPNVHDDRRPRANASQRSGRTRCWAASTSAFFPEADQDKSARYGDREIGYVEDSGSHRPDAYVQKVSHHSV